MASHRRQVVCLLYVATLTHLFIFTNTELYTALVDLEGLLYTEKEIVQILHHYIDAEDRRMQKIKHYAEEYDKMSREAENDVSLYLAHPVNAYLLVKRLTSDWRQVADLMRHNEANEFLANITVKRESIQFPDDEDLSGAATALMRLQDTYKLDTSAIARGEIVGVKSSPQLTAGDCFELGRQSYFSQDFYHTVLWMQESLDKFDLEQEKTANLAEILEHLAYSTYMQGNLRHAIKLTEHLIDIMPDHPRAAGNIHYYGEEMKKDQLGRMRGDPDDAKPPVLEEEDEEDKKWRTERRAYEKLCRAEITIDKRLQSKLKCYYHHNNAPYLYLQPFKREDVYFKPWITLYRNILQDREIEIIKRLAAPRLRRATVQNSKTGILETAHYRISKSAWLKNEDDDVVKKVNRRIKDITGLEVETAEDLQVVNYGIGGHYEPHFDFARKEEKNAFKELNTGNRIATLLFYMTDVEAGGATVFPLLNLSLWPEKGSAAFWFNLLPNGEGDLTTRHAACPVLAGSKWVSNKWFHEVGQEFRRPCGFSEDDYK